jgi:hypothetical protein
VFRNEIAEHVAAIMAEAAVDGSGTALGPRWRDVR